MPDVVIRVMPAIASLVSHFVDPPLFYLHSTWVVRFAQ